ncbi:hypothetical protein D3P08_15905 [Paenibacillus nanensis]|uniref:Endo-polygalacturonase n=1 Tax=Paenibacillus nanensis TaxID=393251 RepID=A0A3A1UYJ7_9BACL|nr:glycosyl hydrolase family 28 protein [Paenibacillus nanensis]RIX51403.1 hypothetical protein D3P08_15905 [Paenibacillus nanensis]
MNHSASELVVYSAPEGAVRNPDFTVKARVPGGEWRELFPYLVRVDMHDVREASMAALDLQGLVEVEVTYNREQLREVEIRPLSKNVNRTVQGNTITFQLDRPCQLSIEANGDRFHNLHLFAIALDANAPDPQSPDVLFIEPGDYAVHEKIKLNRKPIVYFGAGMHRFEDGLFHIPSNTTVYLAGGAVIVGSLVCDHAENVRIGGRGIVYLRDIEKTTYWRSVQINYSRNVTVEDIISIDPPHYSIHLGQSENVHIRGFKSFSTRGWCDGIDMMSCRNIHIEDVFLRTSDDCIAIYGSRGEFKGDTCNVRVSGAVLWADVAHPIMIGVHGDHEGNGDTIENITFYDIDILEHHEPQDGYWGCMAINAGDQNTVRHVSFQDIRVEPFELGRLIDIRVFWNEKYNPCPGSRVEHVFFRNLSYTGECGNPSVIAGYDADRLVDGVHFRNLRLNGKLVRNAQEGHFLLNDFQRNVTFE